MNARVSVSRLTKSGEIFLNPLIFFTIRQFFFRCKLDEHFWHAQNYCYKQTRVQLNTSLTYLRSIQYEVSGAQQYYSTKRNHHNIEHLLLLGRVVSNFILQALQGKPITVSIGNLWKKFLQ